MKKRKNIKKFRVTNKLIDKTFDAGDDVSEFFDWENAEVIEAIQRVNVDFPKWAVRALDREAKRRNISRQALVKNWVIDKLDNMKKVSSG